jgi:hypothetical protein
MIFIESYLDQSEEALILHPRFINIARYMIGKISTWWENSVLGNRKTAGKISVIVGNSLRGRKNVFRCMEHIVLRHLSYRPGFTSTYTFLYQCMCFQIGGFCANERAGVHDAHHDDQGL